MRFKSRRNILLLEILIAITIIAVCMLPLLSSHVFIYNAENEFKQTTQLEHVANLVYVDILEKLHQNTISWNDIESGKSIPIDSQFLEPIDKRLKGSYSFYKTDAKFDDAGNWGGFLYDVRIVFSAGENKQSLTIPCLTYMLRHHLGQAPPKKEKKEEAKPEEAEPADQEAE
jgi:hypothetical protein